MEQGKGVQLKNLKRKKITKKKKPNEEQKIRKIKLIIMKKNPT